MALRYSSVLAGEYSEVFKGIIASERKYLMDYEYNVGLSEAVLSFILGKGNQKSTIWCR